MTALGQRDVPPLPCPTCPWRRDQPASAIPGFSLELAEGLDRTCGGPGRDVFLGVPMMSCHGHPEGREAPCWGWARQVGVYHLGARVRALSDDRMRAALRAGPDPGLHSSWRAVIAKLRRTM